MEDDHPVRILFVEDVPADAELAARALRKEGLAFTSTRVETKAALLKALEEFKPDVIVSDYALPEFDGMQALKLSLERDAAVPFILFTGSLNEETAVACMKAGASDYVLKDRLRQLPFAVKEVLERKQTRLAQAEAERALRESESRYRELFEAESDAIVLIDNATGNILEANSAAVALYGYDHAELLTKRNVDLSAEPEETQQVTQGTPIIPDQVVTIQLRFHRKKDGSVFPAEITGRFFIRDGRPVHIASIRDITERKQAEEALRESHQLLERIFASLRDAVFIIDANTAAITDCNPAAAKIFGYSREEMLGRSTGLLHVDQRALEEFRKQLFPAVAEKGFLFLSEFKMKRMDGTAFPTEHTVMPLEDEQHRRIGWVSVVRDITERKRAEQEIDWLAKFPSENPNPVLRLSRDGIVMYANAASGAILDIWGCAVGGSAPQFWRDLAAHTLASRENKTVDIECDGRVYSMFITPVAEPSYVNLYGLDITERKRAEEALATSEAELRALFACMYDVVLTIDADGVYRKIAPTNPALLYKPPEELLGKSLTDVFTMHEADQFLSVTREVLATGQSRQIEYQLQIGETVYWFSTNITPMSADLTVWVAHDITDRKQREREMAALVSVAAALRAAPTRGDMLPVIVDKAMSLIKADGGALVMHSPATAEEIFVLSRGNWSDLTGTRLPAGQGISGHVITTGRPYVAGDVRTDPYLDIAAEQLGGAYAAAGVPLLAEQQTIGALLIGRQTGFTPADVRLLTAIGDITANALYRAILIETLEHRVEERTQELTAANQQLIELGQLKDQFISMVSHEYRTPLTTILSSAEMLDLYQAKWSVEKKHEHLQQIQASVKRMTELLDQILIIGKAEAGKLAFNPAPVDLLKICRDVAEELQFSTGREDTLTFTHRGECADARLDVNLVRHILSNLLSNAVKYSPKGSSVEFEVTCKTDWAIFQITDHGIGIPPEDQARMFETFHRAKNVGHIQGTGLGLAIVKHAVDRHGGTIEVVTEVNKGTTCTVRLPIG